jgi:hypothetical protein
LSQQFGCDPANSRTYTCHHNDFHDSRSRPIPS